MVRATVHSRRKTVLLRDVPSGDLPSVPPPHPRAWTRHYEAALATMLWLAAAPLVVHVPDAYQVPLAAILVAGAVALTGHACSLRPFFTDIPDEEVLEDQVSPWAESSDGRFEMVRRARHNHKEELKLLLMVFVLLCALGCMICWAASGSQVVQTWSAPSVTKCSMAQLPRNASGTFRCQDGALDGDIEASLYKTRRGLRQWTRVYRAAPVYADVERTGQVPVAWAVTRDRPLRPTFCGPGLCGILVPRGDAPCITCFSTEEQGLVDELIKTLRKQLLAAGAAAPSAELPLVELTNPDDPDGKAWHVGLAASMYVFTLIGLVSFQFDLYIEDCAKRKRHPSYEPLSVPRQQRLS